MVLSAIQVWYLEVAKKYLSTVEENLKKIKNKQINNVDDYLNKDCVDILISFVLYQKRIDVLKYLNENNLLNAKQTNFMIEENIFLFPFLNKKFLNDETFNKVLEKKAKYFQYFPEKLKKNKEWCIKAISYYGDNIKWIYQSCVNDIDIIVAALNKNSFYMNKLPDEMFEKREIREVILKNITLEAFKVNFPNKFNLFQQYERKESLSIKIDEVEKDKKITNKRKI